MRECIICGKLYEPKRSDSTTCGKNACRCRLSRLRKKARDEAKARLFNSSEQQMLTWLNQHIPTAETELRTLYSIYGKQAFTHAANAIRAYASYKRSENSQP